MTEVKSWNFYPIGTKAYSHSGVSGRKQIEVGNGVLVILSQLQVEM